MNLDIIRHSQKTEQSETEQVVKGFLKIYKQGS